MDDVRRVAIVEGIRRSRTGNVIPHSNVLAVHNFSGDDGHQLDKEIGLVINDDGARREADHVCPVKSRVSFGIRSSGQGPDMRICDQTSSVPAVIGSIQRKEPAWTRRVVERPLGCRPSQQDHHGTEASELLCFAE